MTLNGIFNKKHPHTTIINAPDIDVDGDPVLPEPARVPPREPAKLPEPAAVAFVGGGVQAVPAGLAAVPAGAFVAPGEAAATAPSFGPVYTQGVDYRQEPYVAKADEVDPLWKVFVDSRPEDETWCYGDHSQHADFVRFKAAMGRLG